MFSLRSYLCKSLGMVVTEPQWHHAGMKAALIMLMVAGSCSGGLAIALLLGGWLGLVPYPLIAAGACYVAAGAVGLSSRGIDRQASPTGTTTDGSGGPTRR